MAIKAYQTSNRKWCVTIAKQRNKTIRGNKLRKMSGHDVACNSKANAEIWWNKYKIGGLVSSVPFTIILLDIHSNNIPGYSSQRCLTWHNFCILDLAVGAVEPEKGSKLAHSQSPLFPHFCTCKRRIKHHQILHLLQSKDSFLKIFRTLISHFQRRRVTRHKCGWN